MRAYVTIEGRHACFQTTPFDDDAITWMRALEIKFLLSPAEHQSEADTVVVEAVARMSEKELNVHVGRVLHHWDQQPAIHSTPWVESADYMHFFAMHLQDRGPWLLNLTHMRWRARRDGMVRVDSWFNSVTWPSELNRRRFGMGDIRDRIRLIATEHPVDEAVRNERKQRFFLLLSETTPGTHIPLLAVVSKSSTPLLAIVGDYAVDSDVAITIWSNCKFLRREALFASERRLVVNPTTEIVEVIYGFLNVDDRDFCCVVAYDGKTAHPLRRDIPLYAENFAMHSLGGIHLQLSAKTDYSHICFCCSKEFECIQEAYRLNKPPRDNYFGCECHHDPGVGSGTLWFCSNVCYHKAQEDAAASDIEEDTINYEV